MELGELIMELREEEKASSQVSSPHSQVEDRSVLSSVSVDRLENSNRTPNFGAVVLRNHDGSPLVYENDPPHIRVFGWTLINLLFVPWERTDIGKIAKECALSISEVRKGLARLIQDGDLMVEKERGKEFYWLAPIRYPDSE